MIEQLQEALKIDSELYYAYQANIAMAFKDEFYRMQKAKDRRHLSKMEVHEVANNAAKHFLDLLKTPISNEVQ